MNYPLDYSKKWMSCLENNPEECTEYFNFFMAWIQFNSCYTPHYKDIKNELDKILEFAKDNKMIYLDFEFKDVLEEFKKTGLLYNQPGDREAVDDMQKGSYKKIYFNQEKNSCEDFFKVIYQIRCNLFHGDKDVSDKGNKKLVYWAYKYLNIFWKKFLEKNS